MPEANAQQAAKLAAAQHALTFLQPGMVVGLGSGSTATLFIRQLGEKVKQGFDVRGIASSDDSERLARELGIAITDFEHAPVIDVAVDGADEIGPGMSLIKGGGGKLLREKIGSRSTVVWNPWSVLTPTLPDLPEEGWRRFCCVEVVNAADDRIALSPGATHGMSMTLRLHEE